jgi:hypothetical protein
LLLFLLVVFLEVRSLELPTTIFSVTYARETMINEWDARWTEISEGVHYLGWAGQDEESWRKFDKVVGDYQWVVRISEL